MAGERLADQRVGDKKYATDFVLTPHEDADEFFLVLDGEPTIALRDDDREQSVTPAKNRVFAVPGRRA